MSDLEEITLDEEGIQELTEEYGDGYATCHNCQTTFLLSDLIESFVDHVEASEPTVLFEPEELDDILYRVCESCGKLSKHSYTQNLENDAEGTHKPIDSPESDGFSKPFSI